MKILITGGAGFIGVNLAHYLLKQKKDELIILDNLSRPGSEKNLAWLQKIYPHFKFIPADVRDYQAVVSSVKKIDLIYHLAAQVAVTTSVMDPITDFEVNVRGTLNLLEVVRKENPEAVFIFSSTNKVYGGLQNLTLSEKVGRYFLTGFPKGISETMNLDFYSPYGCSKGAADQYVRDYSRIYGLKTMVFRQSCIYGPHQSGNEDQGWITYIMLCALSGNEFTIYGDGKQVRDILFVDDLISAFESGIRKANTLKGEVFNLGGGKDNILSLLELIAWLEEHLKTKVRYKFSRWRPGDQRVYISDIRKAQKELDWQILIPKEKGLRKLLSWLKENR
ncbi:MAG: CDP-paratose 2-epimerase [candidate division WS2 bacterium]|nr:CDP-paratose 2-epimerase [Candidatus Psychracetigena formicireducens]MBT9151219.1 CDP-paratose 2-epimerase [Candidatus Psychracetigena formicireducens]